MLESLKSTIYHLFINLKRDIIIRGCKIERETSLGTGMHESVCMCCYCAKRTVDVTWNAEIHPHRTV